MASYTSFLKACFQVCQLFFSWAYSRSLTGSILNTVLWKSMYPPNRHILGWRYTLFGRKKWFPCVRWNNLKYILPGMLACTLQSVCTYAVNSNGSADFHPPGVTATNGTLTWGFEINDKDNSVFITSSKGPGCWQRVMTEFTDYLFKGPSISWSLQTPPIKQQWQAVWTPGLLPATPINFLSYTHFHHLIRAFWGSASSICLMLVAIWLPALRSSTKGPWDQSYLCCLIFKLSFTTGHW